MITLYGTYPSRSNRAQWVLEELELPYRFVVLDFAAGDAHSDTFRALNPAGKIPVLQHEDLTLTESGAICNYLATLKPEAGLMPSGDSAMRAKYDQWMFFAQTELEQPMWTKAKHKFALPREYRVDGLGATTAFEFSTALDILSAGLGDQEFILGGQFTAADIMLTHTLGWAKIARFKIEHDNVNNYISRNLARPAVARMDGHERIPFTQ
ncbi:MAG: glutathione S-transferase family protein [Pseudomonadota bacterium]